MSPVYSDEFKVDAVRRVLDQGRTVAAAAGELGIAASTLRRWVEQAEDARAAAPKVEASTSQADRQKAALEAAKQVAALADTALGREDPKNPFAALHELQAHKVVPQRVALSREFQVVNAGVGAGAFGLKLVGVAAGGTVSSALVGYGATTVGDYVSFGQAWWATLSLAGSVAIFMYLLLAGFMKSPGHVGVWILASLAVVYTAHSLGFDGPTLEDMQRRVSGKNPFVAAVALMEGFAVYYTPVAYVGGIIVGLASGWIARELEKG